MYSQACKRTLCIAGKKTHHPTEATKPKHNNNNKKNNNTKPEKKKGKKKTTQRKKIGSPSLALYLGHLAKVIKIS